MFLQRIEIQGFKSFANKTTFLFPGSQGDGRGITAIIGPNGSGKSNVADAVRWVLGEQSLKLLRSKRQEDVIFFGSSQKAQKGFCEVSLVISNDDRAFPVDYPEVVVTRRLYRDGVSEYLLNKNKVRLADIALMLAQAHIGQRSYSVIGQGMVDAILQTAPAERKDFFNEAVGVRQYQIKRDSAALKQKSTNENLAHAETILSELEPKMRFFARQLKRLEEREEIERAYRDIQKRYLNALWNDGAEQKAVFERTREELAGKIAELEQKQQALENELPNGETITQKVSQSQFMALSKELSQLQNERQHALTRLSVIDSRIQTELITSGKGQLAWISKRKDELTHRRQGIIEDIALLTQERDALAEHEHNIKNRFTTLQEKSSEQPVSLAELSLSLDGTLLLYEEAAREGTLSKLKNSLNEIGAAIKKLKKMLDALIAAENHSGRQNEPSTDTLSNELRAIHAQQEIASARMALKQEEHDKIIKELENITHEIEYLSLSDLSAQHAQAMKEKEEIATQLADIEKKTADTQRILDGLYQEEKAAQLTLLALQKNMNALAKEHDFLNDELTRARLELAKIDARQEELLTKICDELRVEETARAELISGTETVYSCLGFLTQPPVINREEARVEIVRLKRKTEQIGTIDADVVAEHEETKQRYEFLSKQVSDLTEAKQSLQKAIGELDAIIHERFEENLEGISKKFGQYFHVLFGGGTARLSVMRREKSISTHVFSAVDGETNENEEHDYENDDIIAGIEIEATPPGKKFKSLSFLSGGEKALTAIALLCAILAQNPSPFVVLDEVDAALDESNANRFTAIIKDLSKRTQFILITHNRVTIHIAHVLYGVTMGAGGVSNVLSIDIRQLDGMMSA